MMIWGMHCRSRRLSCAGRGGWFGAVISGGEIESDLAQQGEVASAATVARPAVVLAENDVEHPM